VGQKLSLRLGHSVADKNQLSRFRFDRVGEMRQLRCKHKTTGFRTLPCLGGDIRQKYSAKAVRQLVMLPTAHKYFRHRFYMSYRRLEVAAPLLLAVLVACCHLASSAAPYRDRGLLLRPRKPLDLRCEVNGRVIRSGYTFNDNCSLCLCDNGTLACSDELLPKCYYYVGQVSDGRVAR
jgi:hypothetical protein